MDGAARTMDDAIGKLSKVHGVARGEGVVKGQLDSGGGCPSVFAG